MRRQANDIINQGPTFVSEMTSKCGGHALTSDLSTDMEGPKMAEGQRGEKLLGLLAEYGYLPATVTSRQATHVIG